ncbi:hypothetical protein JCM11957_04210 [Caminibacter profundus]
MKIIKRYLPKAKCPETPLDWKYLKSREVLCLIDKLLNGEMVNQVNNNCGVSKITNAIAHIRKFIGYENIMNVRIDGLRCDLYELVRNPQSIQKLKELKLIIEAYLKEPLKRKGRK